MLITIYSSQNTNYTCSSIYSTNPINDLSFIMAEQEDERRQFEERIKVAERSVAKSVTWKAEKEEEEMIRLAIEASLADDKPPDHSHLNHVLVNAREIAQGSLYASTDEAQQ